MNIALWIVAAALAVAFAAAGFVKATTPQPALAEKGMGWTEDFSPVSIKGIGVIEVVAAIGLVLPPLVGVAPALAGWAAVGLAVTMVGAIVVHARRGETQAIVVNVVLLALAAFVAWGRLGSYGF